MTALLVDIGNARIKYAIALPAGIGPVTSGPHDGNPEVQLRALLERGDFEQIIVADVTGIAETVSDARLTLVFAEREKFGVKNSYAEPQRLGADRWAAMVAARTLTHGPVCIVDAGSALTLDLLDNEGHHLGGWIVPGIGMSIAALASHTRRVAVPLMESPEDLLPGRSTAQAVNHGALQSALGLVQRGTEFLQARSSGEIAILVTGGDGARLLPWIPGAEGVENMVLLGLRQWVAGAAS